MGFKRTDKVGKSVKSLTNASSANSLASMYGCKSCPWIETDACPHLGDVTKGRIHANGICSQRATFIKGLYEQVNSSVRLRQVDLAVELTLMDKDLFQKYMQTEDLKLLLPYAHINKNLVGHLDKMRRQDEGIKLNVNDDHETARRIIDISVAKLEEKGIREISDLRSEIDNKPNKSGTNGEDSEQV